GNSGGPFYVQYNGDYYPAGVYLGTLYNGVQPYASAVRAIDSNVVNLVTLAQTLGDAGTNHTGGGVIAITAAGGGSARQAYLVVNLGPPEAVSAGAGCSLNGGTYTSGSATLATHFSTTSTLNETLSFKSIPGWYEPPTTALTLTAGQTTSASATYVQIPPPHPPAILGAARLLSDGRL